MLFHLKEFISLKYSLLALLLLSCSLTAHSKNKTTNSLLQFKQYQISAPFKVSQPAIAINLFDNESASVTDELVLIGEDAQHQAWLAVYVLNTANDNFTLVDKIKIANKYFAYDVAENTEKLYFLAKNEIVTLSYNAEKPADDKPLLSFEFYQTITSIYLVETSNFIAQKDFIQDINADGVDDIVLPHFNQLNLWLSNADNTEVVTQSLSVNTTTELREDSIRFSPKTFYSIDLNLDNLQDIAWVEQGSIQYFPQLSTGLFSLENETIALNENIHGLNWWQIREADGDSLDQSQLSHRVVEDIKDINGDDVADVIVRFTQSSGVLERTNDYEFYYGKKDKQENFTVDDQATLSFSEIASTVIKADGTLTGLTLVDINNDNNLEVLLSSFELSLGNIIGALISGGIDQNVLIFNQNDHERFEEDAIVSKEVELSFSLSKGRSGAPIVRLIDVNGDGLQDLVLSIDETQLQIYVGNQSSRFFARKGIKKKVTLPKNGDLFSHHDINHDGKEDFLMHYGRLDGDNMANTVTILLMK